MFLTFLLVKIHSFSGEEWIESIGYKPILRKSISRSIAEMFIIIIIMMINNYSIHSKRYIKGAYASLPFLQVSPLEPACQHTHTRGTRCPINNISKKTQALPLRHHRLLFVKEK